MDFRQRIKRIQTLPMFPGVVKRLCGMVESDIASAAEVGNIIGTDQVLTAKVLKIVNSSFYGFRGRITAIDHALVLLGFNVIKSIVITAAVIDYMTDSMVGLWEHSLGVATAADKIARNLNIKEPEEISTAGLLHDLGKVILCVEMHDLADQIRTSVESAKVSYIEAEKAQLDGISHCDIAGWLMEQWNLPLGLRDPVVLHHSPDKAKVAPVPVAIVHIADILTRSLQFGSGGDPYIPIIHPTALDSLGLRMIDLAPLLREIDNALESIDTMELV